MMDGVSHRTEPNHLGTLNSTAHFPTPFIVLFMEEAQVEFFLQDLVFIIDNVSLFHIETSMLYG